MMMRLAITSLLLCGIWISANAQPAPKSFSTHFTLVANGDWAVEQYVTCLQVDQTPAFRDIKVTDTKIHDRDYDQLSAEQRGRGVEDGKQCRLEGNTGLAVHNRVPPGEPIAITCAQNEIVEFYASGSVRSCELGFSFPDDGPREGTVMLTGDDDRDHECRWGNKVYFNKDGTVNMRWTVRVSGPRACP
jgi:hypothetical protein